VGKVDPVAALVAALMGGFLAAGTHATKAGTRVLINTSPEPISNWIASVLEDVTVIFGMWAALYHPWLFLVLLIAFMLLLIWILPKIWRGIKKVFSTISSFFSGKKAGAPADQGQ
jgi:Na+/proline symporter